MKQRNESKLSLADIKLAADVTLGQIAKSYCEIACMEMEAEVAMQALQTEYGARIAPLKNELKLNVSGLMAMMKFHKPALFDGTDVVRLANGSLIHSVADKVSIPRDALARCEELGFAEVIKIAKSLDRDAVEKWPDERLILIGAERKQKEEFSYDLAGVKPC